jgi:mono/diheme cytochrome c family protein
MRRLRVLVGVSGLVVLSAALHLGALQTGATNPPLMISSVSGRDLFAFYCSACHGRNGEGQGPVAPVLRVAPPDLTRIAARNDGVFPKARVEMLLTGDQNMPPAHGSSEMPVWGPIFSALDSNERINRIRIANIVEYIASIQTNR